MKKKRLDFEIMRIVAIFLVVFNHTEYRGFSLYLLEGNVVNRGMSLVLAIVCKIAVPLFLLISGGLLLNQTEPLSVLLKKRVLRMVACLLLFSGILYGFWIRWGYATEPGVFDFISRVWNQGISQPYWYLYAYTALLLMLPFLRPLVRGMPDSGFVYLFLLHVLWGISIPLGYLLGLGTINSDFSIPFVEQNLFYFLMGYYLAHRFPWEQMSHKRLWGLTGVAVVAIGVMLACTWTDVQRHGESTWFFMNSLGCFPVFAVYGWIRVLVDRHPVEGKMAQGISTLGGCVFGTYLLEGILRRELIFVYNGLESKIHVLPACLVWVTVVVICGLGLTWILKKLPVFRRLL